MRAGLAATESRVSAAGVKLELESSDSFEAVREIWRLLPTRSIFSTWGWNATWWRHFGRRRPLRLNVVRDDQGSVVAIIPLYVWRQRGLRVVRFVGSPHGDELGPIGDATAAEQAAALDAALAGLPHDVFLGEQLDGEMPWAELLRGCMWRVEAGPVLGFEGTWEEYLESKSANFRGQVRRLERRLRKRHQVVFRLVTAPEVLDRELDVFFSLHRARWSNSSDFLRHESFYRDVAAFAAREGFLRLWMLDLDGDAAAGLLGYRVGGVESYVQFGRSLAYARESLGFVLLAHTLRAALTDRVGECRLLRGGAPFKYRFANTDPGRESVVRADTRKGRAAVAAGLALMNVRRCWGRYES
jgi:CelD/BcsL family acetyltransferase involved in cellulose biosynthesis